MNAFSQLRASAAREGTHGRTEPLGAPAALPDQPMSPQVSHPDEDSNDIVELSVVIPVFNGAKSIGGIVQELHSQFSAIRHEIILVNDGSSDDSEAVCAGLVDRFPGVVFLLQLARNFGEHNAVLAGLKHASGSYVAVLDDDGQNLAKDVLQMYLHARESDFDTVYGKYRERRHSYFRVLGSRFNDRVANLILKKPRNLYLSSFKVMSRLVVDEVCRYAGPFPYLDGLILRTTRNVSQIEVDHRPRQAGRSGYTLGKLLGLWSHMFVGFSIAPLRISLVAGIVAVVCGLFMVLAIGFNKLLFNPQSAIGISCLVAAVVAMTGVQLIALGMVGEYIGRVLMQQSGMPQYVLRYVRRAGEGNVKRSAPTPLHQTTSLRLRMG